MYEIAMIRKRKIRIKDNIKDFEQKKQVVLLYLKKLLSVGLWILESLVDVEEWYGQ